MFKKTNQNLQNHEKSQNSLTLLKEFNNNIYIVFEHYDIISMRKRILYFKTYLAKKSEISEGLKNLKILKIFKKNIESENLKNIDFFGKNLKI